MNAMLTLLTFFCSAVSGRTPDCSIPTTKTRKRRTLRPKSSHTQTTTSDTNANPNPTPSPRSDLPWISDHRPEPPHLSDWPLPYLDDFLAGMSAGGGSLTDSGEFELWADKGDVQLLYQLTKRLHGGTVKRVDKGKEGERVVYKGAVRVLPRGWWRGLDGR